MQHTSEITFHPGTDLSDVGLTDIGWPLYRVVLAETRLDRLYDSKGNFREIPMYLVDGWILERYLTAEQWAGTPEQFKTACDEYGYRKRYPSEGEYDCVTRFGSNEEVELARDYARFNRYGMETFTPEERATLRKKREEYAEKERQRIRKDIIADAAVSRFGRSAEQFKFYNAAGREIVV